MHHNGKFKQEENRQIAQASRRPHLAGDQVCTHHVVKLAYVLNPT
jgi:hypothetical protein